MGGGRGDAAPPFLVNSPFGIVMVHNGNVINYRQLKKELFEKYHRLLNSDNDVEAVLNVFAEELAAQRTKRLMPQNVYKAVDGVYKKVKGSYSVIATIAEQGMVAFRDPYGIKPLVYGIRRDGLIPSHAFASESVALNIMGFTEIRDVKAGEVVYLDQGRTLHRRQVSLSPPSPVLFEWGYFARPDSFIDNVNVYLCRVELGRLLAAEVRKQDLKIDVVVPVPDSARDAAIGL